MSEGVADSYRLLVVGGDVPEAIQAIDRALLQVGHYQRAAIFFERGLPLPLDVARELGGLERCRERMAEGIALAHEAIANALDSVPLENATNRDAIERRRVGLLSFEEKERARRSTNRDARSTRTRKGN